MIKTLILLAFWTYKELTITTFWQKKKKNLKDIQNIFFEIYASKLQDTNVSPGSKYECFVFLRNTKFYVKNESISELMSQLFIIRFRFSALPQH